ncbi:MAG: universal stress protein [Gemmatimonadales bacterium]|nr:MAG: universal stress protein [Gemmatimonadales bacterium]
MDPWTVVVGVDHTPEARDAAAFGRRLAEASGGSWHLITAAADPLGYTVATTAGMDVTALDDAVRDEAWRDAAAALEGLIDEDELRHRLRVGLGRPESVISQRGDEVNADLYVLGGHHRGRARSWIHRSTARHLIRVTDRPVLITGPEGPEVSRVLAAVDFGVAADPVIQLADTLAELLDVPLEAAHVVHHPGLPDGREFSVNIESLMEAEEREAREQLWAHLPDRAGRRIVRGHPTAVLETLVTETPGALLVLGAQGRGWMDRLLIGSTTESILSALPSALAVVPARAVPQSRREEVARDAAGVM